VFASCKIDNNNGHLVCNGVGNERSVPSGGYQSSCEGCRVERAEIGEMLHCAFCRAADGSQREASIKLTQCPPPGNIDNSNGVLSCKGLPHAPGTPAGSYRESCEGCRMSDQLLTCTCRAADGVGRESKSDVRKCKPPAVIGNNDGKLTCARP